LLTTVEVVVEDVAVALTGALVHELDQAGDRRITAHDAPFADCASTSRA